MNMKNNSKNRSIPDKPKLVDKKNNDYFAICFNCGCEILPELPNKYLCLRCQELQDDLSSDDDWVL